MDHPIPIGRRAALYDAAFWVPMAGIVSRIAHQFGMGATQAGTLISSGMASGEIGHMAEGAGEWIVTPRAAELVRLAGFDYETMLSWQTGSMGWPGAASRPVLIFWPDVERAARGEALGPIIDGDLLPCPPKFLDRPKPKQAVVNEWIAAECKKAFEAGRPPPKRDEALFPACKKATGATDRQMREAFSFVPEEHKRSRGNRDRADDLKSGG